MVVKTLERMGRRSWYTAAQLAKVGWYTTQYVGTRHMAGPFTPPGHVPKPFKADRPPETAVRKALFDLLRREGDDIAKGIYKVPREFRRPSSLPRLFSEASRTLQEARAVARRSYIKGGATEVRDVSAAHLPTYYRQNFHFQTDGWLTDQSAQVYDGQVEALFTGAADAMRRRALPVLLGEIRRLQSLGVERPAVADIGCGTGRLLADLMDNAPGIKASGIDLSAAYLRQAQRHVGKKSGVSFVEAAAEALPFDDASQDILFSVYLFHELPRKVRAQAAAEFARVLKPGGLYVHVDTVQYGDTPMDMLVESFPRAVHEPYYDEYCKSDLTALFNEAGLCEEGKEIGFLTKVTAYRR